MPINLAALKTEIQTDPQGVGYAGKTNFEIAELLNTPRGGAPNIDKKWITAAQLQEAVDIGELNSLTNTERESWNSILTAASANPRGLQVTGNLKAQFASIWAGHPTTLAALQSQRERTARRLEEVFAAEDVVDHIDVRRALKLP